MEMMATMALFALESGDAAAASAGTLVMELIIGAVTLLAYWMLFIKAGEPGWMSIIPIMNGYKMFEIVYGSGWKYFLCLVPILNFVLLLVFPFRLAQAFGKSALFGLGLLFLSPIFMLILAFDNNTTYNGPVSSFI